MVLNFRSISTYLFLLVLSLFILWENFFIGLLVIILFFACFFNLIKIFTTTGRINIFNAKNQFLLHYFLIHGIGFYAYLLRCKLFLNNYKFDDILIIKGIIYALIGIFVFQLFYKLGYGTTNRYSFNPIRSTFSSIYPSNTYKWVILIITILVCTILFWYLIGSIPFTVPNYNSSARAELGKGLGYIEAFDLSLINLTLLLFIKIAKKKKYDWNAGIILLLIASLFILNADRGGLIYYILTLWFIYSIYNGQPTLKQFSFIAVIIILMAGILGVLKSTNKSNLLLSGTIVLTEVAVEFDNYNEVFNMVEKKGYLGGSTLVPIFTLPIPRSIMPDKDKFLTAGNYFKEYHNHNHIRVGERMGFIGEFYLNFGVLGILIGMAIIGLFLGYLDKSVNPHSIISVFIYIQLIIMSSSVGGDIPTAFITFVMKNFLLIATLFLLYFYNSFYNRNAIYRRISHK